MINKVIAERKSSVLFTPRKIEEDLVNDLFEAARWAPSSRNEQPWRFIYALHGERYFQELLGCLNDSNQIWVKNASMLILTVAKTDIDNRGSKNPYAWHDTAMAYSNLVFQAVSVGLAIHPMGGYKADKSRIAAGLPENFDPVIFAAVGYRADPDDSFLPDLIGKENKERIRRPLSETVFHGKPGNIH